MRRAVSFLESAVAFDEYRLTLKSVPCPHCRGVGNLIRHGFLRGYAEDGAERVVRGWRIYCSKRNRRKGCGHTHSVLKADLLPRRSVRAARLWQFLAGMLAALILKAAWEKTAAPFTLECGYRLWRAFVKRQSRIRTALCQLQAPPQSSLKNPLLHGIQHLRAAFVHAACPVRDFQLHFQRPFLG